MSKTNITLFLAQLLMENGKTTMNRNKVKLKRNRSSSVKKTSIWMLLLTQTNGVNGSTGLCLPILKGKPVIGERKINKM